MLISAMPGAATVLPGFIDLQINGAFGHDFTSDPASIWTVGRQLPQFGVTAFLPTIISSADRSRSDAYNVMRSRPDDYRGAEPLGLHLEGPLIADERHGAHPRAVIAEAAPQLDRITDEFAANSDVVTMVTIAPELSGAVNSIIQLSEAGIVVSLGHSSATEAQAAEAFDAGARAVTHLFNAMAPLHHRETGLVGAALTDQRVSIGLIADNVHVSPGAIKLVWDIVGPRRLMLVTDAVAGLGAPPGRYRLGHQLVNCDVEARSDADTLAGSMLDLPTAASNLRAATGLTDQPESAEEVMGLVLSGNQARLLGRNAESATMLNPVEADDLGFKDGDMVVVDHSYGPLATYIGGVCCWQHPRLADLA